MPLSRQAPRENPAPTSIAPQKSFSLPASAHLLITTPGHIYSWDSTGVHTLFRSSQNGILAAREAQDGSSILAVADRNVVVLHDTKRGQERSWGLKSDEDEVRHLEYTSDTKSLFLSTNLTSDIQRYSTEQSRLLSPTSAHASPPAALAVSSTGHLMVSASNSPPTVYLNNLTHNSSSVLIESRASEAAVTCIAFHPDRPDVFLLAFADGVVAAFDATKIARKQTGTLINQEKINRGEIGRLNQLHRPTLQGRHTHCVEAAAFLPGYRTRAVTVGRDGKCRIIDFADGGVILRTWHAKAPVASVSVLARRQLPSRKPVIGSSRPTPSSTEADSLIAIGRVDGIIQLYDSVGLLLEQKTLRAHGKVISVEWVIGKSPRPITNSVVARGTDVLPVVDTSKVEQRTTIASDRPSTDLTKVTQKRRNTALDHIGLPPSLRKSSRDHETAASPARQFTAHPDELVEGTVRHTPFAEGVRQAPVVQQHYLDLFSPVKVQQSSANQQSQMPVPSPPRTRPKVSSQTFVKSPPPDIVHRDPTVPEDRNTGVFPSTDARTETFHVLGHAHSMSAESTVARKRTAVKLKSARRSSNFVVNSKVMTSDNARILADLRRLGAKHSVPRPRIRPSGAAATTSPRQRTGDQRTQNARSFFHRPKDAVETDLASEHALKAYEDAHDKQTWPDDSHQGSSLEDDIWLTSDDEHILATRGHRKCVPPERPPARQTSRARMGSRGTVNTVPRPLDYPITRPAIRPTVFDGSAEDDMYPANETYIPANGMISPSSRDIQKLFPRSSSLSPRKHRRRSKAAKVSPTQHDRVLQEITSNAPTPRQTKTTWTRARASKDKVRVSKGVVENEAFPDNGLQSTRPEVATTKTCCGTCDSTHLRMQDLESEVGRLKGEVLVLKAVMRRQGLPMPPSLRS